MQLTISLVDDDAALAARLRETAWPLPVAVSVEGPEAPRGQVVLWNAGRHPESPAALGTRLGGAGRAWAMLWDQPPEAHAQAAALEAGALGAFGKDERGLAALVAVLRRHGGRERVAAAQGALVESLVDRSFALALINEVLEGVNAAGNAASLYERAVAPLLEGVGAHEGQLLLADQAVPAALSDADLARRVPGLLAGLKPTAVYEVELVGERYLAAFPMLAQGKRQGNLLVVGAAALLPELDALAPLLHALCGQLGLGAAHLRALAEARELAVRDSLTGLYNHGHFQRQLAAEFDRARRYESVFSVVMIDLDHFKRINDTHGHPTGDRVLVALGALLGGALRQSDTACRYGGEEFALLLPETSPAEAVLVAERLRERLSRLVVSDPEARPIGRLSASFGVAGYAREEAEPRQILERADRALYRAKRAGRDRVVQDAEPAVEAGLIWSLAPEPA